MRILEFLGSPGAGKSTILAELVGSFEKAGDSAADLDTATLAAIRLHGTDRVTRAVARFSRSSSKVGWRTAYVRSTDRFAALPRFLAANPQLMEVVLAAQRRRQGRDLDQERVLSWVLNLMASAQLAREASEDFDWVLVDEGFCQRAIALFAVGFDPEDEVLLRSYLHAIPVPSCVIVVETPLDVCEKRLDGRDWSERLTGLNREQRRRFLDTTARIVELVALEVETLGARVIRVDGSAPIEEVRDAVTGALIV